VQPLDPNLSPAQRVMLLAIHSGQDIDGRGQKATTIRCLEKYKLIVVYWNRVELTTKGYEFVDILNKETA
jgi:hypothetical protein